MLKHLFARLTVASVLACAATLAAAGQGTSADELLHDADDVLLQFDAGRYADVWNEAAPFMKGKVPKDQFADQTRAVRQTLGVVTKRGWASVVRIQYANSADVPDGLYANVDYSTTLANGRTVFEMLSFRLENDGRWRLTGYAPRQSQGSIGGPALPVIP